MKLNFKIDIEKDFENYYETLTASPKYGEDIDFLSKGIPEKIKKLIAGKTKQQAHDAVIPILQKAYEKYQNHFKIFIKQVKEYWEFIGPNFIKRFERITNKKFKNDEIIVYLTTICKCPYDYEESWFMISFLTHPLYCCLIIAHELMHFHFFCNNFQEIKEKIGEEKAQDLKEALTVLLNIEFKDLFFFEDKGYKGHKELREFIAETWKKEKDYDKLLNKCVAFLKNNGN